MLNDVLDDLLSRPRRCIYKNFYVARYPEAIRGTIPRAGGIDEDPKALSIMQSEDRLHEMRERVIAGKR